VIQPTAQYKNEQVTRLNQHVKWWTPFHPTRGEL
jgi:hypothetical protein